MTHMFRHGLIALETLENNTTLDLGGKNRFTKTTAPANGSFSVPLDFEYEFLTQDFFYFFSASNTDLEFKK